MITLTEISALLQVVMVDLVLAGDNALVVGMVAASVAREDRAKAIMIGIVAATLMRVVFGATWKAKPPSPIPECPSWNRSEWMTCTPVTRASSGPRSSCWAFWRRRSCASPSP